MKATFTLTYEPEEDGIDLIHTISRGSLADIYDVLYLVEELVRSPSAFPYIEQVCFVAEDGKEYWSSP